MNIYDNALNKAQANTSCEWELSSTCILRWKSVGRDGSNAELETGAMFFSAFHFWQAEVSDTRTDY